MFTVLAALASASHKEDYSRTVFQPRTRGLNALFVYHYSPGFDRNVATTHFGGVQLEQWLKIEHTLTSTGGTAVRLTPAARNESWQHVDQVAVPPSCGACDGFPAGKPVSGRT